MAKATAAKSFQLKGGKGNDTLIGGSSSDLIRGMKGDDTLIGGRGGDLLMGGKGADNFKYLSLADSGGRQVDVIADFDAREGDRLDLRALGTASLQTSYNAAIPSLQAVFTYNAATNQTTLSYFQGSSTAVFKVVFLGRVAYSESAFLGITRVVGPTEGGDNLVGTANNDTVDLLGGNDTYDGLAGNDTIRGGAGNDLLKGGVGEDSIFGGTEDDRIIGGSYTDQLYGGSGADTFIYREQSDSDPYRGEDAGVDLIHDFSSAEGDKIDLTALTPKGFYLVATFRYDLVHTGSGQIVQSDQGGGTYLLTIYLPGDRRDGMHIAVNTPVTASDFVGVEDAPPPTGTEGHDSFFGTGEDDTINLLGGDDNYDGLAGNDTISGGSGDDALSGSDGNDTIDGGDDADRLYGDDGDDTLFGGDWISGSAADGADLLDGGAGNDQLNGWYGDDKLLGGAGDDLLHGSFGTDTLIGGSGADIFSYTSGIDGNDVITDFSRAEGDKIDFSGNDSNQNGRDGPTDWWFVTGSFRADLQASGKGQIVVAANGDGTYTFSAYFAGSATPSTQTVVNTVIDAADFLGVTQAPATGAMGMAGLVF